MAKKYAAIIFDIIKSRTISDRFIAQKIVKDSVNYLNELYNDEIVKRVVCGSGDEFQGLFENTSGAFDYVRKLQMYVYPVRIRCGIGYGTIKYFNDSWLSTEIDGDAYYKAREAINSIPSPGTDLIFLYGNDKMDKYINTFMISNSLIKKKQSSLCRLIETLIDFLYPIGIKCIKNDDTFAKFCEIIDVHLDDVEKRPYSMMAISENRFLRENKIKLYQFDREKLKEIFLSCESKEKKDRGLYVDGYIPHGTSTLLSQIIGSTVQNINKHINLGHIKESRALDEAIYAILLNDYDSKGDERI